MACAADNDHNHDEGWGWEALGSEDDPIDCNPQSPSMPPAALSGDAEKSSPISKASSEKSLQSKKSINSLTGITSSPSFQELEKAIGATIAANLSSGDMAELAEGKSQSPNGGLPQRHSSTNLIQQKLFQHRHRQHLHQSHRSPSYSNGFKQPPSPSFVSTKQELFPFINETESRALILFHSPALSQAVVREACAKFGVLYYIRPEFHARGVTFISYFDLQAASAAKNSISEALGANAEASAHYSVMLHATSSNSEEFRLVVKNLPSGGLENEIESVFSRYGPLRSIQKTFSSSADLQSVSEGKTQTAYSVEYYSIQDARLAVSELSATSASMWGPDVSVKFAALDDRKRQLCQQLLATLSRWRSELASVNTAVLPPPASSHFHMQPQYAYPPMQPVLPPMPVHVAPNMGYGFYPSNFGAVDFVGPHGSPFQSLVGSAPPMLAPGGYNGLSNYFAYPSQSVYFNDTNGVPDPSARDAMNKNGSMSKDLPDHQL